MAKATLHTVENHPAPLAAYTLHEKYLPREIVQAVIEIKKTIDPAKRGEQGQDGERTFAYAGVDDIFAALQRPMAEHGMLVEVVDAEGFDVIDASDKIGIKIAFQPVIYLQTPDNLVIYDNPRAIMRMFGEWTGNNTCASLRTLAEKTFLRALFKLPAAPAERPDAPSEANPRPHEGSAGAELGGEGRKLRSVLNPLTLPAEESATQRAKIIAAMESAYAMAQDDSQDGADHIGAIDSAFKRHQSTWARLTTKDQELVKAARSRLIGTAAGGNGDAA
jgi:hypothetical protein